MLACLKRKQIEVAQSLGCRVWALGVSGFRSLGLMVNDYHSVIIRSVFLLVVLLLKLLIVLAI